MSGPDTIAHAKRTSMGFLSPQDVATIAKDDATRLSCLLIRWHEGRALVPAQNVDDLIAACTWTVRDVSVPA